MDVPEPLRGLLKAEAEYATLIAYRRYLRLIQDSSLVSEEELRARYQILVQERHRLEQELAIGQALLRRN